jgi:transcriptional regulator with XRE-family HTH domain
MTFVIRQFDTEKSIGELLRDMRKAVNLTLGEAAAGTKVRRNIIEALEANAHERLPEPLYSRNFLRAYVKYLGGNEDYFLERFEAERKTCDFTTASRLPRAKARAWDFFVTSKLVKVLSLLLVAGAVIGYLGWQWRGLVAAPTLQVQSPADGERTVEATIRVAGAAEPGATVLINGVPVLLNPTGGFDTEIVLERGLNVITVESHKRYSKTATEYRRVLLDTDRASAIRNAPSIP